MANDKVAEELVQFLRISAREELKIAAISHVAGLTSDSSGLQFMLKYKVLLEAVMNLLHDKNTKASSEAYKALINLTANESASHQLIEDYDIIPDLMATVFDRSSEHADDACMILNNLTISEKGSLKFLRKCKLQCNESGEKSEHSVLKDLLNAFCTANFNQKGAKLDYIASVFANISQTSDGIWLVFFICVYLLHQLVKFYPGRILFLNQNLGAISMLLPYLTSKTSPHVRRKGVCYTLKNCCFEHEHHEWLLGEELELLPQLLLPIAGPEELSEEENDKLPLDLQYLPDDKEREGDPEIRQTILETLLLLCATKFGRLYLKNSGTYYLIRELHLWEMKHGSEKLESECEKLVQVLIADEPEPGMENLMTISEQELNKLGRLQN